MFNSYFCIMKYLTFSLTPFIITLVFCTQCNFKKNNNHNHTFTEKIFYPKYAKNFFFSQNNHYTTLYILINKKQDTLSFKLISKTQNSLPNSNNIIYTPVEKIIATSTTDIPYLEALEKETTLVGFTGTNYISSKKTRTLIDNGNIKDIGNLLQLNTEAILELTPEVFIASLNSNKNKSLSLLTRNAIPVLINNSWLETHPLGRAEWIKVFGALYKKEALSEKIFNSIEANYLSLKKIANKANHHPTILSGNLYKDIWYTPAGNSFEAKLINDANGDYAWKNSTGVGSLALSIESILEKSEQATIWLGSGAFETIEKLTDFEEKYRLLKATKTGNVYTKDLTTGTTGGILYFETGALRPDWILKDLIQIFHPNLIKKTPFHFYKKLL